MSHLKAFVGHSFTEDDEDVVRIFLEYFDEIANMNIGFSWAHAKKAEPVELASKVLGLIEGKNLFIGICTRKEHAVPPGELKPALLNSKVLKANIESFSWKTSDWVIQEIGLSIGRGMPLLLLVEDGVRKPGGLQGDTEYISFSRDFPERSFGKLLQMIRALLPKVKEVVVEVGLELSSDVEEKTNDDLDKNYYIPKPDWAKRDYEFALMHSIGIKDKDHEEKISQEFLESELCVDDENKISWRAFREYMHLFFSDDGSLDKLRELARAFPDFLETHKYLARGLQLFGEHGEAAKIFREALEKEIKPERKLKRACDYLLALVKSENDSQVSQVLEEVKTLALGVDGGAEVLLTCLKEIAEIQKDALCYVAYLEALVAMKPDDINLRFKLAYEHSEKHRENLALFHYLRIPPRSRSAVSWNNLGVSNSSLNLDALSIEAYRKSEELDETLAMSNLALKLMGAGFLVEAEELCLRAIAMKDHNKNVDDTLYKIKKKKEDEAKEQEEVLVSASKEHKFYRDFGNAAILTFEQPVEMVFQDAKCKLYSQFKDGKFFASGDYEQADLVNALSLARIGGKPEKESEPIKYRITYEVNLTGLAGIGTVTLNRIEKPVGFRGLLSMGDPTKDVLVVVSDDFSRVRVMEKGSDKRIKFYDLNQSE